jgi:hypothetical protein
MLAKILNWKTVLLGTVAVLGSLYFLQVIQAPKQVLKDVLIFEEGNKAVLKVEFNVPVRYENHFPEGVSDFIQVKIRAVSLGGIEKNEYVNEDIILSGWCEMIPITDIAYEGAVPGGPLLSFRFSEPVSFRISEESDMRSIMLHLPKRS